MNITAKKNNILKKYYHKIEDIDSLERFYSIIIDALSNISNFEKSQFLIFNDGKLKDFINDEMYINIDLDVESLIITALKSSFTLTVNNVNNSFIYNESIDNLLNIDIKHLMIIPLACNSGKGIIWSFVILYKVSSSSFTKDEVHSIKEFLYKSSDIITNKHNDITCQHAKEEQCINSNSLQILRDKIERQQQFFSSTIHDIRTPINSVMGFLELLKLDEEDLSKNEYIDLAFKSSQTVNTLINDVLDISKIEAGKLDINIQFTSIVQEFEELSLLFSYMTSKKKIDFIVCYDPILPYIIRTDIDRIKQIVGNLLSNAIKFTPIGGYIEFKIGYNNKNDSATISIRDNGIGISADEQRHIFTPFKQASKTTSSKYGGTGLGLSISKELTHLLGGELKIDSKKDEGSIFYFTIPCKTVPYTPETIDRNRFKDISLNIFSPRNYIEQKRYDFICKYFSRLNIKYNVIDIKSISILEENRVDKEVFILIDSSTNDNDNENRQSIDIKKRLIVISDENIYKKHTSDNISILNTPIKISALFDNIESNIILKDEIKKIKDIDIACNVLIIDDNKINLRLMGEIIKKLCHIPYLLDTGSKLSEVLDNNNIDIVFVDQHMPDIDGDKVIKEIKRHSKCSNTLIYGLTGSTQKEITQKMLDAGAVSVLTKPIHLDTIVKILDSAIKRK